MIVFWVVAPCSLVETDLRFTAIIIDAVETPEKSVNIY
jgi:hypothetical protein